MLVDRGLQLRILLKCDTKQMYLAQIAENETYLVTVVSSEISCTLKCNAVKLLGEKKTVIYFFRESFVFLHAAQVVYQRKVPFLLVLRPHTLWLY